MSECYYVLTLEGETKAEPDVIRWAQWFHEHSQPSKDGGSARHAGYSVRGDVLISTVFLGFDHGWGLGDPVLWETMVFGGSLGGEQARYRSREEAELGHAAMVRRVELTLE